MTKNAKTAADNLLNELIQFGKTKRMKVKTLMNRFDYDKRTEDSATQITELLFKRNIIIHPSIMKIEDNWQLKLDDQVYLSLLTKDSPDGAVKQDTLPVDWNEDGWFDNLSKKLEFIRNEKEVESKLMIPILIKLGYDEENRWDGMAFGGAKGSKSIEAIVDFALFNNARLPAQVLLIAEAKKEDRLNKPVELEKARNQVRSYGVFANCLFGLITDAKKIEVIALYPLLSNNGEKILFECTLDQLKDKFRELHKLISKDSLTNRYEKLLKLQE
jgi:hypothetical protein